MVRLFAVGSFALQPARAQPDDVFVVVLPVSVLGGCAMVSPFDTLCYNARCCGKPCRRRVRSSVHRAKAGCAQLVALSHCCLGVVEASLSPVGFVLRSRGVPRALWLFAVVLAAPGWLVWGCAVARMGFAGCIGLLWVVSCMACLASSVICCGSPLLVLPGFAVVASLAVLCWLPFSFCCRLRRLMVGLSWCGVYWALVRCLWEFQLLRSSSGRTDRPASGARLVRHSLVLVRAVLLPGPPLWPGALCWCWTRRHRRACCAGAVHAIMVGRAVLKCGLPPQSGMCACAWPASFVWLALLVPGLPASLGVLSWWVL